MKKLLQKGYLEIQGKQVPVKITREDRGNKGARFSIGKHSVNLRLPSYYEPEQVQEVWDEFLKWVNDQFEKHERLHTQFFGRGYKDGDILQVGERQYTLKFSFTDRKTHNVRLSNHIIYLSLSKNDTQFHLQKSIKYLLSRVVAQDFKPEIGRRVNELNNMHFNMPVKSLNLKYNQTNWGSCSSKNNLNLSTRLLFAPEDVVDYVIIHELAHLIELNHSSRFWKLVENAMPDYKEKEKWLDENDHLCHF